MQVGGWLELWQLIARECPRMGIRQEGFQKREGSSFATLPPGSLCMAQPGNQQMLLLLLLHLVWESYTTGVSACPGNLARRSSASFSASNPESGNDIAPRERRDKNTRLNLYKEILYCNF